MEDKEDATGRLSVVVPCRNNANVIRDVVEDLAYSKLVSEIVVVDDGSSDGTREVLRDVETTWPIHPRSESVSFVFRWTLRHSGEAHALSTGLKLASGDYVAIRKPTRAYEAADYALLLQPISEGWGDVVFGRRETGNFPRGVSGFWGRRPGRVANTFVNISTRLRLADPFTDSVAMRREVAEWVTLTNRGESLKAEFVARVAMNDWRVCEAGVSYSPSPSEDAPPSRGEVVKALYCVSRHTFLRPRQSRRPSKPPRLPLPPEAP